MKHTTLILIVCLAAGIQSVSAQCTASYTINQPDTCAGSTITFNGGFVPLSVNLVWHWYFEPGATSSSKNTTHTYNPAPGSGNVNYIDTLIVTDTITGCSDTVTFTVTVKQKPNAVLIDLFGATPFTNCNSIPGNYVLTVDDGSTPAVNSNYQITWGGGLAPLVYNSATAPMGEVHTYNALGFFNLVYTVTGTNGCIDNTAYQVFNGNAPAVGIGINQNPSGCTPLSLDILILNTAANPPGTTYTIHFTDGSPDVILPHPPPPFITHLFNATSCGYSCNGFGNAFCATITAQNPCASSFAIVGPIYVSSQSGTNFTTNPANIGCSNSAVSITNTSTAASINNNGTCTSTTPSYWTITPGGYTINSGQLGTSPCNNNPANWGSANLNVTFPPGTYDITLTVCSPCGDSIITKNICITDPPASLFTLNPITGCKPLAVVANNTSTPTAGCSILTYNWTVSFTPSPCSLTANGNWAFTNGTNAASLNPEFIFNDAGTYTVTLTASNGCNPASVSSQDIIVTAPPLLIINPIADSCGTACVQPVAIYEDCGNTITNYSWTFAGCLGTSTSSLPIPPQICYPPNVGASSIVYTINCTTTNGCGNSLTASTTFTIYPVPAINNSVADISGSIMNDGIICDGNNATITAIGTGNFTWLPVSGLSQTTGSPVIANPSVTTIYTVTITDANGCTATNTQTITVNTLPNPAITETDISGLVLNDQIICANDSAILDAGVWNTYLWSDGTTNMQLNTHGIISTTTYTVTVTDINGCDNSINATITVNPLPTPVITGLATVCSGASANLDAGSGVGWNYQWSSGTTNNSQFNNPTASGLYTVTVTDANGCSDSNAINVIVGTNPVPAITGTNIICQGASTIFDAGASAGWTYQWSTSEITQAINIIPPYNASYTVTVTDADGCTGTNNYGLTVNPLPTPAINGVTSICAGASTSLCANAGYINYQWNTFAVTSCINPIITAGTYTVTVTDGNNCTASVAQAVIVNPLPGATISGASTICPGGSTVLSVPAGNSYLWSNSSVLNNITVSAAGTFTVTVTSPQGCTSTSAPFVVNVGPASATINAPAPPYCTGNNIVLAANAGTQWLWSTGATTQNITIIGSGNYTVTVTQGGGCTASTSQAVTFFAPPNPVINGPAAICQGVPFVLDAGAGYSLYNWTGGAATQTISPPVSGTYTVTVTNVNGCTASVSHSLTVNAAPNPAITGINSICQGGSTTFNASAGYINYQWNTGANTQTINIFTTGTYTITVTALNNCTASTTRSLTVNALPTPVIGGVTTICGSTSATLNAGAGYVIYQWSTGASTAVINPNIVGAYTVTVIDVNGCTGSTSVNLNVNTNPTPLINGLNNVCQGTPVLLTASAGYGNYLWNSGATTQTDTANTTSSSTYTVTVTDVNGCTGSTTYNLNVNPAPAPVISGNNTICQATNTVFNAGAGFTNYQWNTGANTQTITVNSASTYTVIVTSVNSCTGSASVSLTVNPLPMAAITGITAICSGSNATLNATAGYPVYQWSNGFSTASIAPAVAGNYTVTVTDVNGCTSSASAGVTVNTNPITTIIGNNVVCQNEITTFDAGAGFATYNWSNGFSSQTINPSSLSSATFTVTVTDNNGCTGTASYNLTVNPLPTPVISGATSICSGANTTLDAGGGYSVYQWNTGANLQTVSLSAAATYTVTVTDLNGCTGSASNTITVNVLPTPTITGTMTVCAGVNALLDAGVYSNYQWSDGTSNSTITPSIAGAYIVTVTDGNGCTGSTSATVTVNANPIITITGNNVVCQNSVTTFDGGAGFVNYSWSNGANSQTINPSTTASATFTVTVTDNNGCTGTASYNLNVNALPTPVIAGVTAICSGASTTFDAGAGYSVYQWNTGANTQTVSLNSAATYTVTVTDLNGCTGSASNSISVNPLPVPSITGITAICSGANATLNATSGYVTYQWSDGSSLLTITPSIAGLFTVTVTDGNGCTGSAFINVIVNSNPIPVITGNNVICNGAITTFDAGAGYSVYQWNTGANSQTINPPAAGTYTVTVTDANGCTGTSSYNLSVNPLPTPVVTGGNTICQGSSATLDAGSGYIDYLWSNGESTQTVILFNAAAYTVTVTDVNGCTGSTDITLTVNPLPIVTITGVTVICFGSTTNLNAGTGFSSYQWSTGFNGQVLTTGTGGNYTVTVTDGNGCSKSTNITLTVNPNPAPVITGDNSICTGQVGYLDAGSGFATYQWSTGVATQAIYPAASGTYSVTVTDVNGCTGTSPDFVFTVHDAIATISTSAPVDFCNGDIITLTANSSQSYFWSTGETTQSIFVNQSTTVNVTVIDSNGCEAQSAPLSTFMHDNPFADFGFDSALVCKAGMRFDFINKSIYETGSTMKWTFGDGYADSIVSPTHYYQATGTYTIKLTVTSPYGCIKDTTYTVDVDFPPPAIPLFSMSESLVPLFNAGIHFTNESLDEVDWQWIFGDELNSVEENPTHYYDAPGTFPVKLIVRNSVGCPEEITHPVTVSPFWIPNTFTPNGDHVNDLFLTSNYVLDVQSFEMTIYNRWADIVYRTDSFEKPWDGSAKNGGHAQEGTYVYVIKITTKTGRDYKFTSIVDLVR